MNCQKCDKPMLCEDLGEGHRRYRCTECGVNEVQDREGRKLLLDQPEPKTNRLYG
jgi:hypothetical protein